MIHRYEINDVLLTKDGTRVSNAVVVNVKGEIITVLSDFGNVMEMDIKCCDEAYTRLRDQEYMEDFPEVPWKERLQIQIDKLQYIMDNQE